MAWTVSLDAVIGNYTKASDYDKLVANAEYVQTLADIDHDFHVSTGTGKHKTIQFLADSLYNVGSAAVRAATVFTDTLGDTGQDLAIAATTVTLPSGFVFNFASSDITITHSTNTLTIAGIATRVDLAAGILEMNNAIEWDTGVAVVAGEYSAGRDADATNQLHFNVPTGATFEWSVNDVSGMVLTGGPILFLNDTSDAGVTVGLVINQGAADNYIFTLKSSDVAHGITDKIETDSFFAIQKYIGLIGGAELQGFTETTVAIHLLGYMTTENTTKTAAGEVAVKIQAQTKSGTGFATPGANANIFGVGHGDGTLAFIVDFEGDLYADGTTGTGATVGLFDEYDDLALLSTFDLVQSKAGVKGLIETEFEDFVSYNEQTLIEIDILGGPRIGIDPSQRGLINYTGLVRLHNGAIRQLGRTVNQQQAQILALKSQLLQLVERN